VSSAFADTNLFLRFLTQDPPDQAAAAERALRQAAVGEISLVTTPLVFAELAWTLRSFYGHSRHEIAQMLLALLNTPGIEVETSDRLIQTVVWYEEKNVDFIDAYHAAWLLEQPFKQIYTFDQKHFKRFQHLQIEVPGEMG
jgi:predicted nucleic acid-binding protein